MHKWSLINKALDMGQPEPVETYSSSPHLYADLDIPEDAKGRLKSAGPAREREPRSATASASGRGAGRGGQHGSRDGGSRDGASHSGGQRSGAPRERTRSSGATEASRGDASQRPEGAGTHDGTGPTRRRRNRTRRPSAGTTPPSAA
jgi:hypothetical protein